MIFGFGKSRKPLVIRQAEMTDAPVIANLHAQSFDRPWGLMEFERMLAEENIAAHVAAAATGGDRPEGFVLSRIAADEAEVLSIAVAPERRGEGVGRRLLEAHREVLLLSRVRVLFLEVEDSNVSALALYARQGFREVSRRQAYYRKADGSAATALVMRVNL
ncbi:MAG: ribosomal protein S18-alanine N-acetyltransferase [Beijerinckiaceae bacterium]